MALCSGKPRVFGWKPNDSNQTLPPRTRWICASAHPFVLVNEEMQRVSGQRLPNLVGARREGRDPTLSAARVRAKLSKSLGGNGAAKAPARSVVALGRRGPRCRNCAGLS